MRVDGRAKICGAVGVALFAAVYLLAVWTAPGQRLEDAVLQAASGLQRDAPVGALALLSPWTLAAATLVVLVAGWLRGGLLLGGAAAGVVGLSVVTCRVLREWVLVRPILLDGGYRREDQSYPSGHTAAALAVMCALVMVTPARFRCLTLLLTSSAVAVGNLAVAAGMHRPSDTLGSGCVVLFWVCAALLVLHRAGYVRDGPSSPGSLVLGMLLLGNAVSGLALGAYSFHLVAGQLARAPDKDELVSGDALFAGRVIALAGGVTVALVMLVLLHRAELSGPGRGNRRRARATRGRRGRAR